MAKLSRAYRCTFFNRALLNGKWGEISCLPSTSNSSRHQNPGLKKVLNCALKKTLFIHGACAVDWKLFYVNRPASSKSASWLVWKNKINQTHNYDKYYINNEKENGEKCCQRARAL